MHGFKIGQRVRMARPWHPENMGAEGTILRFFPEKGISLLKMNCLVDWDRPMKGMFSHTNQLEPLVPPHEGISWEAACFDKDGKYRQEAKV